VPHDAISVDGISPKTENGGCERGATIMRTLLPPVHLRGVLATLTTLVVCPLPLITCAFFSRAAQAASIEVLADETSDHPVFIFIKGQFLKSEVQHDVTTFATLAAMQKRPAIVFLEHGVGLGSWVAARRRDPQASIRSCDRFSRAPRAR
jgi:hypothetical protein